MKNIKFKDKQTTKTAHKTTQTINKKIGSDH